ncbi:MAG: hypothetical protein CM1200mP41_25310 [Gammaproteobacteria bacterium]|nr:MAG: hypothetical protein CM1200mP41_25310 [Gammaproteobacteria bacterium]
MSEGTAGYFYGDDLGFQKGWSIDVRGYAADGRPLRPPDLDALKRHQGQISADAPGFGNGRGGGLDCPQATRLTLKATPMPISDFNPRELGLVSKDDQKRAPCTIAPRGADPISVNALTKAGGPTGHLCVDGCELSQDGEGQATRIIDATGGAYQHLVEGFTIRGPRQICSTIMAVWIEAGGWILRGLHGRCACLERWQG